ncbi:unnamed protein product [Bemisia tabaci]|uniref:Uncharacterized protein n=2 Tax=Bemisia tabaci TaxID=7038 RepID=A0A9P0F2E2_BEMTA|nr:unnamed protein product [Bemisia tabaci]
MANHTKRLRGYPAANVAILIAAQLVFSRNLFLVLIRAESSASQQIGLSFETNRERATEYFQKLITWSSGQYVMQWRKPSYAETPNLEVQGPGTRLQIRSEDEDKDPTVPPPPPKTVDFEPDGDPMYGKPVAYVMDPHEDELNERIEANGVEIWESNPCQWYNAGSDSHPNKKRMKHCNDAKEHLERAGFKDGDSSLCPKIDGADCFQVKDHFMSGRCYARVISGDNLHHYVLMNNCVRDWMKTKHIRGTEWPTANANSTLPATPEVPHEPTDIIPDGDPKYRQPEERSDDPPDDVLNREMKVNGHRLWWSNPCHEYGKDTHSDENHDRRQGCHKYAQAIHDAGFKNGQSKLCPQIDGADCFQFFEKEKDSRCYAKVKAPDGLKYVLFYSCVRDWQKQNNLTHETKLIPEGAGFYDQPELKPTDPSDEEMDENLKVGHTTIWETNPCRYFAHVDWDDDYKDIEDARRLDDCRNAVRFMKEAGFANGKSKLCPQIDGANCFQFKDFVKSGRCYAKVNTGKERKYILLYDCVKDWQKGTSGSGGSNGGDGNNGTSTDDDNYYDYLAEQSGTSSTGS